MEFLKKNWNSLDTLNNYCDLIELPSGDYCSNGIRKTIKKNTFVTSVLITNQFMIEIINENNMKNHFDGTYRYFNDINSTSNVHWDYKKSMYMVDEGFDRHPFRGVTWQGALAIARLFSGRLLTELEWEICAKSGHENYIYPWGNDIPNESIANYGNFYSGTTDVCKFSPNDWGLYDMAGNLREWCMDDYNPNYRYIYDAFSERCYNNYTNKVVKGGAWDKTEYHLNCNLSEGKWSRIGTMGIGFRILVDMN